MLGMTLRVLEGVKSEKPYLSEPLALNRLESGCVLFKALGL